MNRRIIILDDKSRVENYRSVFANQGNAITGNQALKLNPGLDHYDLVMVQNEQELRDVLRNSLQEQKPFIGAFLNLELGGTGVTTLKEAKKIDPHLLCVIMSQSPDKSWELIHEAFGDEFSDHWDLSQYPLTDAQVLQKAYRMNLSWERRRREREYLEKISKHEEQLMRAERLAAIGTLSRGLGTEFGNMLHTIMGKADVALNKRTPEAMESALKSIVEACEKVSTVVRNLQSLVKTEVSREAMTLAAPIDEALGLIEFEMKKSKVKLVKEYDGEMPQVKMNKFEINQVFLNIMINAIHAMEKTGGTLTVKTVKDAVGIAVSFSDTGCGIPAENMPKIFEPLFTTKVGTGSGIGLSVTKKIVENHGGKIKVASSVGKGTTFTIWLPKGL